MQSYGSVKIFVGDNVIYQEREWKVIGSYIRSGERMVVLGTNDFEFLHVPSSECEWTQSKKVHLS